MSKGTDRRTIRIRDDLWRAALVVAQADGDDVSTVIRDRLWEYVTDSGLFIAAPDGGLTPAEPAPLVGAAAPREKQAS